MMSSTNNDNSYLRHLTESDVMDQHMISGDAARIGAAGGSGSHTTTNATTTFQEGSSGTTTADAFFHDTMMNIIERQQSCFLLNHTTLSTRRTETALNSKP
jgi:hypothetical protein